MGKCSCGAEIDDKYKMCLKCAQEMKKTNQEVGAVKDVNNEEVIKAIGAMNNNLYAIRTILELMIWKEYKQVLYWDKETKSFLWGKAKKGMAKGKAN